MKRNEFRGPLPGILLCCLLLAGCGRGVDLPPTAEVSGTVTLDGVPLTRGTVQFAPDGARGAKGAVGVGLIDADGRYVIRTAGVEGALVGWHNIGVVALEEVDMSETSYAPSLIPDTYNNPMESGLTFEVLADKKNDYPIRLTTLTTQ